MTSVRDTGRWNFKAAPADMTGERHGRLVCVRRVASDGAGRARWLCRCDCGAEVIRHRMTLLDAKHSSCGCWMADNCRALGRQAADRARRAPAPRPRPLLDRLTAAWGGR